VCDPKTRRKKIQETNMGDGEEQEDVDLPSLQ
jgi:hypothetical protein